MGIVSSRKTRKKVKNSNMLRGSTKSREDSKLKILINIEDSNPTKLIIILNEWFKLKEIVRMGKESKSVLNVVFKKL